MSTEAGRETTPCEPHPLSGWCYVHDHDPAGRDTTAEPWSCDGCGALFDRCDQAPDPCCLRCLHDPDAHGMTPPARETTPARGCERMGHMTMSDGRHALIEVATQLLVRGGLPEPIARAYATADQRLQDQAIPVAAVVQRLLREAQEPVTKLNALLAESGTSVAEFAARVADKGS